MRIRLTVYLLVFVLLLFNCGEKKEPLSLKTHPNDPFIETITESQYFEIDSKKSHVIEGINGTILILPNGCFLNTKGQIFNGEAKVELVESLDLEEMILSNLTTTSNGQILETDGMIYFNATTANGEELIINKNIPVHIEIPTTKRVSGMMAYKGIRDENGNMNWIEPQKIETYLIPVDINLLDFYPKGFEAAVQKGMPFKGNNKANSNLIDSLYYSMAIEPLSRTSGFVAVDINEPYDNKNAEVIDGRYTEESFTISSDNADRTTYDLLTEIAEEESCGINPATIKVIKEGYQNTLLATREFEQRIKVIFDACRNDILEMYVNNIDKNLYELDSIAARMLNEHDKTSDFIAFYNLKQTNVKEADKYSKLLKGYYEKRINSVNEQLKTIQQKAQQELEQKNEIAKEVVEEYKEVLLEREKHRMETYGFEWTSTGWINVDIGTQPKTWGAKQLTIKVENGRYYDNVFTYVVYPNINSIYRLNSEDKENFYAGNKDDQQMLMPKKVTAISIAIAHKNGLQFLAKQEFVTGETDLLLSLDKSTKQTIKKALSSFNKFGKENNIEEDLKFMETLAKEKKRQETLQKEQEFINSLYRIAFACCYEQGDVAKGERLFQSYCASCHEPSNMALVGPGLAGVTSKYPMEWIIQFTQNSTKMIEEVDPLALKIYEEHNKVLMPSQPVSDEDVKAIFAYVDSLAAS